MKTYNARITTKDDVASGDLIAFTVDEVYTETKGSYNFDQSIEGTVVTHTLAFPKPDEPALEVGCEVVMNEGAYSEGSVGKIIGIFENSTWIKLDKRPKPMTFARDQFRVTKAAPKPLKAGDYVEYIASNVTARGTITSVGLQNCSGTWDSRHMWVDYPICNFKLVEKISLAIGSEVTHSSTQVPVTVIGIDGSDIWVKSEIRRWTVKASDATMVKAAP